MKNKALRGGQRLLVGVLFGLALLIQPRISVAQEPTTAPPSAEPKTESPANSDMNFDLLGDSEPKKLDPAAEQRAQKLARQVKIRRGMLVAHQALGFVMLAAMTATTIIGHLNYQDRYVSGDLTDRYQTAHRGLAIGTSALFGGIGILGLAAPNPYPKPLHMDTVMVHRIAMALATAGMVTQIILGTVTAYRDGRLNQPDLAFGHVVVGYATWTFTATGVVALMF